MPESSSSAIRARGHRSRDTHQRRPDPQLAPPGAYSPYSGRAATILRLQRQYGNFAVQRLLAQPAAAPPAPALVQREVMTREQLIAAAGKPGLGNKGYKKILEQLTLWRSVAGEGPERKVRVLKELQDQLDAWLTKHAADKKRTRPDALKQVRDQVAQEFGPLRTALLSRYGITAKSAAAKAYFGDTVQDFAKLWSKATPKAPRPLAADELVLTTDAAFAKDQFLTWFRDHVKDAVEPWGLGFAPAKVTLAKVTFDEGDKRAVILKWDASWGAKPSTTHVPFDMSPIEARAAVTGAHKLKGWDKVPAEDQAILDNLLGGETNRLSVTARSHLRGMLGDLKTKSAAEQAQALTALAGKKEAMPNLAEEPVAGAKVEYTLTGPTAKKGYAFRGKTADAEEWKLTFKDGVEVPIVAPKAPEAGYHNHTVQQVAQSASFLPKATRSVITTIVLNPVTNPDDPYWAVEYSTPDFHSYMTAGAAGVITIYPDKVATPLPEQNEMTGSLAHETGHTWSYKTWGTDTTKGKWIEWKQAMDKDKAFVSSYAQASIAEDIAETIAIYATTKGSPQYLEYQRIVPHRFAMLDKEYK